VQVNYKIARRVNIIGSESAVLKFYDGNNWVERVVQRFDGNSWS
jgi:hypothetical protein